MRLSITTALVAALSLLGCAAPSAEEDDADSSEGATTVRETQGRLYARGDKGCSIRLDHVTDNWFFKNTVTFALTCKDADGGTTLDLPKVVATQVLRGEYVYTASTACKMTLDYAGVGGLDEFTISREGCAEMVPIEGTYFRAP